MLSKLNFSHEAIVLAALGEVCFNSSIRLLFIALIFLIFGVHIPATFILAPVGIAALITFGAMLGLFLVPVGMIFSDVNRAINILTTLWFFVTPVVYTLPDRPPFDLIVALNPVGPLIAASRDLMTVGVTSSLTGTVWVIAAMPILLVAAWVFYRLSIPHFIERLTAR
jgi:lipopolysaccharide transport system permease protein